jgi:glycosyltransferase involved in cell wall biosynthesis
LAASGSAERINPGDPEALARRIQYLANDPERLLEMGRFGEDYARLALSADGAKGRAIDFVSELLARAKTIEAREP